MTRMLNIFLLAVTILFFTVGCGDQTEPVNLLTVTITVGNETKDIQIPPGITVEKAIDLAGISINPLDRVVPPSYSVIDDDLEIEIFRVSESFNLEEIVIPFETQTMKNETLPEGQTLLVQAGVNGIQQNTYRVLSENGVEVSSVLIKQEIVVETKPEIIMVGIQTPYTELAISGKIAYLTAGNAWIMEETSGNRYPVITSGDLDGRIFSLSPDGNWLLFTRAPAEENTEVLNELWMLNISSEGKQPIYLRVNNIIHFAEWHPTSPLTIAYSTVEPRETAPGWQANNDLYMIAVNENGIILRNQKIIEENSGGIYGWWGTEFLWSNLGDFILYSRPDSIGIIDLDQQTLQPLVDILPLQTRANWAWVPGVSISPQDDLIYFADHGPFSSNTSNSESSQDFSLSAFILSGDLSPINLVESTGMFAYPSASPLFVDHYRVAYLQAIFPEQSETSGYQVYVMDQDSSNAKRVFPPEGAPGLDPQKVVWGITPDDESPWLGLLYQGNLWLIDLEKSISHQLTGDGSITRMDWN